MGWALQTTDLEWARGLLDPFPISWQSRLFAVWERQQLTDRRLSNMTLLQRVHQLSDSARGGIRPDANDGELCHQAETTARDFARRLGQVKLIAEKRGRGHLVERLQSFYCRALLAARGLLDLWPVKPRGKGPIRRPGAIKRMQCPKFWRRVYRKLHARTVEACAIGIGLVRKTTGLYASDDSVKRRAGQNARNAAVLDSVVAVNDHGQDFTLAELAAKGTANKAIRRGELLTRIAGFELIAKECGHVGFMVTMTCPSRFHPCTTLANGQVVDNRKYDGSTPDQAQRYLSKAWARCRSMAARCGVEWYGFRIAEPQHDSTPHWHCLLFVPKVIDGIDGEVLLQALVRHYFLDADSPHEPGAQKHRVDFERIEWHKGSAVGYVIKYVSKNIDGHGVGLDLFGNDAITSSQRVEAWASTWRIRQFQQIGGAPVGVWRELRRVHPENVPETAPEPLRAAMSAMNVAKVEPGVQAIAWKRYTHLQGGWACKRKSLRVRLLREQTGECGTYGEAKGHSSIGVEAFGVELFRNHIHEMNPAAPPFERRVTLAVESERAQWLIGQGGREQAIAAAARLFDPQRSGAAAQPRIHVNNCTGGSMEPPASMFAPVHHHRQKLRRFRVWERPERQENGTVGGITKESRNESSYQAPARVG